ncbi:hypothetical protein [Palleronia sp.]|uniref:hypothetical protein n=1 Tax=Palleronia sp. TaxID=1940284 RepID=UPI0035C86E66
MTEPHQAEFDIGHPAPDRGRISRSLLAFALLGAPVAWSLQLSGNAALGGLGCLVEARPRGFILNWEATAIAIVVVNVAALVIAVVALAASAHLLRETRHEKMQHSGGVMQAGEGRTRYMAVWGVWGSVLFLIAIGANTVAAVWRNLCGA